MKAFVFVASAALILALSGEAMAVKLRFHVTPKNAQDQGFSVASARRSDGTVQITITRELSKARSHAAGSGLIIRRSVTLKVCGDSGLIVECKVDAEKKGQTVVYEFVIGSAQIARSSLTVAEIDDYKDNDKNPHLLGGGTFYEFKLGDFVGK